MTILLDTSVLIDHLRGDDRARDAMRDALTQGHQLAASVVVVATDPADPPSLAALRAHVKDRAPAAYAPRHLVVVDALPRDGLGKIPRSALDALVARADL
jgi:acyl-coenzyme A synthetase/AMP-(fatty) acid ligase